MAYASQLPKEEVGVAGAWERGVASLVNANEMESLGADEVREIRKGKKRSGTMATATRN